MIVLAGVCVRLGNWQFDRLHERQDENALVSKHIDRDPVPIDDVVQPDADSVPADSEWTPVTATGHYDGERQVVEKYMTRDGVPGVEVITPLVTSSGTAVLVNRGWMEEADSTATVDELPPAPTGKVTLSGWIRVDSGADDRAIEPSDGQVRAISSEGIETALPYGAYPGYVNRLSQQPPADDRLDPEPTPDLGQGPHFFYAMQWYFFAILAVFGWFYFAWTEAHPKRRRGDREPAPSPSGADDRTPDDEYSIRG